VNWVQASVGFHGWLAERLGLEAEVQSVGQGGDGETQTGPADDKAAKSDKHLLADGGDIDGDADTDSDTDSDTDKKPDDDQGDDE